MPIPKPKEENVIITVETDDSKVVIDTEGDDQTTSVDAVEDGNPVRKPGESGQTFMARCVFSPTMVAQFPDQKQGKSQRI
jgi:hypothetical protein